MLLKQHHHLVLQDKVAKILSVFTAYNNTYVISMVINPGEDESIVHVDADGKVLFEKRYLRIDSFVMLDERHVIVTDVPRQKIDIINLETKTTRSINHEYLFNRHSFGGQSILITNLGSISIQAFEDQRLFVIVERGLEQKVLSKQPVLNLTYYEHTEGETWECRKIFRSNDWSDCVTRANNHSMVSWIVENHQTYELHSFDLKGEHKFINVYNVRIADVSKRSSCAAWEISPGKFMLVGSNITLQGTEITDSSLIISLENGVTKIDKKSSCLTFSPNEIILDTFRMKNLTALYLSCGKNKRLCFINNSTGKVESQEILGENFIVSEVLNGKIAVYSYPTSEEKEIRFKTIQNPDLRMISLHLMLHLNADFDDDLLSDALQLLSNEEFANMTLSVNPLEQRRRKLQS